MLALLFVALTQLVAHAEEQKPAPAPATNQVTEAPEEQTLEKKDLPPAQKDPPKEEVKPTVEVNKEPVAPPKIAPAPPTVPPVPPLEGTVTQIFRDKRVVIATLSSPPTSTAPIRLAFVNAKGDACEGDATQVKDNIVSVQFDQCSIFSEVVAGSKLVLSLLPVERPAPVYQQDDPEKWLRHRNLKFSLSIAKDTSNKISFDGANYTNGSSQASGSITFDLENGVDLMAALAYSPENSAGFLVGYTLQPTREAKGGTVTVNGDSTDFTYSESPNFKFNIFETDVLYRWTYFYMFGGLNYSDPSLNWISGSSWSVTCQGALGYQLGIGFMPSNYWRFDLLYREISASVKIENATETNDYGLGHMDGFVLRVGVMF